MWRCSQLADDYDIAHADLIIEASVMLGAPDGVIGLEPRTPLLGSGDNEHGTMRLDNAQPRAGNTQHARLLGTTAR
jgi:hypothetical protein